MSPTLVFLLVVALIVGSTVLGSYLARSLKMKELGWKLGLIIATVALSVLVLRMMQPSLGIDLRGGDILIYEVDTEKTAQALQSTTEGLAQDSNDRSATMRAATDRTVVDMTSLIESLRRRINPGGVREVVIREYGTNQVEIIIPEVSAQEVDTIKEVVRKTGFLKFRIIADSKRPGHDFIFQAAKKQLASADELERAAKFVRDDEGVIIGEWVRLGREEAKDANELPPYRIPLGDVREMEANGNILTREIIPDQIEVLAVVDARINVEGSHLANVSKGADQYGNPAVDFSMTTEGTGLMASLTGSNLPLPQDPNNKAKLGIVLDDELLSFPVINSLISSNGIIEGNFSHEEVDKLLRVLRDGKMPAILFPEPISQTSISPLLGRDTIYKGMVATGTSLVIILAFMLWYYKFAGLVACVALIANLLMTVAAMYAIRASFTLSGIAGLVLTMGMAVDANVLIYERIREELARGASLRMGIRNGFDRALTTIIDSNVTTLIVAVVLYLIGTADLRGFAVSLTLGLLISMFTAVFCSRVFFEIAERKRWIKGLSMVKMLGKTEIGFLRLGPAATLASVLLILVGIGAVAVRGAKLFDIDFRGGTSVQVALKEPMSIEVVRDKLRDISEDVWITQVNPKDRPANTVYKVDTSDRDEATVHAKILKTLVDDDGNRLLESRTMEFTDPVPVTSGTTWRLPAPSERHRGLAPPTAEFRLVSGQQSPESPPVDEVTESQTDSGTEPAEPEAGAESPPAADEQADEQAEGSADEQAEGSADEQAEGSADEQAEESAGEPDSMPPAGDDAEISSDPSDLELDSEQADSQAETAAAAESPFKSSSVLKFGDPISARTLRRLVDASAEALKITAPQLKFINDAWDGRSDRGYSDWEIQFTCDAETATQLLTHLRGETTKMPLWLSSNTIGGQVAEKMRTKAILAIVFSLLAIIVYIWARFERVEFGFAAVLAVIHDVLVTLGAIALSLWLANVFGFLMIEEFKISLPIIAAFLTLIGYSLNDTIVIFDRMREVKGKSPELTDEMMDLSINQTLSRTILTSFTVLLVVIVLYIFGGEGLHAFAFALLVGVIAGTYSTVFIASPALLWMLRWAKSRASSPAKRSQRTPTRSTT